MKQIINLTPHSLTLVGANGTLTVPPSGIVARLAVSRTALAPVVGPLGIELPVSLPVMGEVTDLPPAEDGVILVVSALVAGAVNRPDVMSPGELIRDSGGNVIGARGLCAYTGGGAL
jgi:hypothetical protein